MSTSTTYQPSKRDNTVSTALPESPAAIRGGLVAGRLLRTECSTPARPALSSATLTTLMTTTFLAAED